MIRTASRLAPHLVAAWVAGAALCAAPPAWAQAGKDGSSASIYTCTDAQGKRLTSDRPIMACNDREQREYGPGGVLRRVLQPTLTATEREARAARERTLEQDRQRARDAIRRDEALVTRYPDRAAHDAGRREALSQSQPVVDAAERRMAELAEERKALDDEMEFYRKDPSKAPAKVRRAIEANADAVLVQKRAIANQQDERNRINARFDEELTRLQALWKAKAGGSVAASTGAASSPAAVKR